MTDLVTLQLRAIAWIALIWNEIEAYVDSALCECLELPEFAHTEVVTRINGFDGKVELIRCRLTHDIGQDHALFKLAELTLGAAKEIKKHRDSVVHTFADFETDTGHTRGRRGKVVTVNIALNTLSLIQEHAGLVCEEIGTLADIMRYSRANAGQCLPGSFLRTVSPQLEFQSRIAQLRHEQKRRKSLPPLPPVPK